MIKRSLIFGLWSLSLCLGAASAAAQQEQLPAPGAPHAVKIPQVVEKKLPNGLTVVVVERKGSPLVAARLMIGVGSSAETLQNAGLANMTADLITKGTKTRDATKIAEDIEFLGADLGTTAGLDNTSISMSVTSDKIGPAMAVMSDIVRNPTFPETELDLLKSQKADELTANLSSPGFLTSYVASVYSYGASPASGTLASLQAMTRDDVERFYRAYLPGRATLFLVGDISAPAGYQLAESSFGSWKPTPPPSERNLAVGYGATPPMPIPSRLLVIDLPKSGQASVAYTKDWPMVTHVTGRAVSEKYFPGVLTNSILGGGYSSRLNLEIRIKRGLSYGAGSSISWRPNSSRFITRVQTKNESAAEVAELTVAQLRSMASEEATPFELGARRASLIGDFDLHLETDAELLDVISDLYANHLGTAELDKYESNVSGVDLAKIKQFAAENFNSGDLIIAGDYSVFKDDLKKRFPNMPVTVIEADRLDLTKPTLQK